MEDYTSYMKNITKLLGYNCENITDEVQEIMDFEISLAKVFYPSVIETHAIFYIFMIHIKI